MCSGLRGAPVAALMAGITVSLFGPPTAFTHGYTAPLPAIASHELRRLWESRPPWGALLAFGVGYVAAGGLSQGLAIIPGISVTFWPPSGIFVVALLLTAAPSWPWWIAVAEIGRAHV